MKLRKATCTQLAIKYGESKNFYNSGSSALARRIVNKTNCPIMSRDNDESNGGRFFMLARLSRRMKKELMFGSLETSSQKLLDELICSLAPVIGAVMYLISSLE